MVKKIFYRKNIIKNAQTDKVDYKIIKSNIKAVATIVLCLTRDSQL